MPALLQVRRPSAPQVEEGRAGSAVASSFNLQLSELFSSCQIESQRRLYTESEPAHRGVGMRRGIARPHSISQISTFSFSLETSLRRLLSAASRS